MGKRARERDLPDNEAKAVARMLRVSPQKLNLVAQLIRGKKVATALADLEFSQKADRRATSRSAWNWRSPTPRTITTSTSTNWSSPRRMSARRWCMKRFHPRGRGRMGKILKPFSNLTIVVRQVAEPRRLKEESWVRRSIRSVCGSASTAPGIRAGIAGKNEYGKLLHEDIKIREELMNELKQAAVSKIVIERPHKKCRVTVHSARPGVVIGKKGADIEKLRKNGRRSSPTATWSSTSSRSASPSSTRSWSPNRSRSSSSAASRSAAP